MKQALGQGSSGHEHWSRVKITMYRSWACCLQVSCLTSRNISFFHQKVRIRPTHPSQHASLMDVRLLQICKVLFKHGGWHHFLFILIVRASGCHVRNRAFSGAQAPFGSQRYREENTEEAEEVALSLGHSWSSRDTYTSRRVCDVSDQQGHNRTSLNPAPSVFTLAFGPYLNA